MGVNRDKACLCEIPMAWSSGGNLGVSTSGYAVELLSAFRGFDKAPFLKSLLGGLLFGNENIDWKREFKTIIPSL